MSSNVLLLCIISCFPVGGCATTVVQFSHRVQLSAVSTGSVAYELAEHVQLSADGSVFSDELIEVRWRTTYGDVELTAVKNLSDLPLMFDRPNSACAGLPWTCTFVWSGQNYGVAAGQWGQFSASAQSCVRIEEQDGKGGVNYREWLGPIMPAQDASSVRSLEMSDGGDLIGTPQGLSRVEAYLKSRYERRTMTVKLDVMRENQRKTYEFVFTIFDISALSWGQRADEPRPGPLSGLCSRKIGQ